MFPCLKVDGFLVTVDGLRKVSGRSTGLRSVRYRPFSANISSRTPLWILKVLKEGACLQAADGTQRLSGGINGKVCGLAQVTWSFCFFKK